MYPWPPHWAARQITAPTEEPITPENLIARARLVGSDVETDLIPGYITAARQQVEQDIGCALLTQRIEVASDRFPWTCWAALPWPPLQMLETLAWTDTGGIDYLVDPADYVVDALSMPARLYWSSAPRAEAVGWRAVLTVGWTPETLPELLRQAVGLLATHYLVTGRDRIVIGTSVADMPAGYREIIERYQLVVLI